MVPKVLDRDLLAISFATHTRYDLHHHTPHIEPTNFRRSAVIRPAQLHPIRQSEWTDQAGWSSYIGVHAGEDEASLAIGIALVFAAHWL